MYRSNQWLIAAFVPVLLAITSCQCNDPPTPTKKVLVARRPIQPYTRLGDPAWFEIRTTRNVQNLNDVFTDFEQVKGRVLRVATRPGEVLTEKDLCDPMLTAPWDGRVAHELAMKLKIAGLEVPYPVVSLPLGGNPAWIMPMTCNLPVADCVKPGDVVDVLHRAEPVSETQPTPVVQRVLVLCLVHRNESEVVFGTGDGSPPTVYDPPRLMLRVTHAQAETIALAAERGRLSVRRSAARSQP